jgi:glutamyl/glutaminyl-tRNA synthetase
VRVEDLDHSRVRPGVEEAQLSDLRALGLDWDGPVVRQSERMDLYEEAIARLDGDRLLYPCYCTRAEIRAASSAPHGIPASDRYPGTCRELTAAQRAEREASGRPPALRVRRGEGPDEARAWMARTLGLARLGEKPSPDDLIARFDPERLPCEPTVFSPENAV